MKYLALLFKAPFASFGHQSKKFERGTLQFPTKSAVFGMLLAAAGLHGTAEELERLNSHVGMEVYDYGEDRKTLEDFQAIGHGWADRDMKTLKYDGGHPDRGNSNKICRKQYLVDVRFGVVLKVDDESLAEEISNSFRHPVWPLYLGRKNCVPSTRIFHGVFDSEEEAVAVFDKAYGHEHVRKIMETRPDYYEQSAFVNDVPLQFIDENGLNDPKYSTRRVYVCSRKSAA